MALHFYLEPIVCCLAGKVHVHHWQADRLCGVSVLDQESFLPVEISAAHALDQIVQRGLLSLGGCNTEDNSQHGLRMIKGKRASGLTDVFD